MSIERINNYCDPRFSQSVLNQHGTYLVDGKPYEIEIISDYEAQVRGAKSDAISELIEEFRFNAPQITRFLSESGEVLFERTHENTITLSIEEIQPSQFYIDEEKLNAVGTFLNKAEDIIIQVAPYEGGYVSLDGHTRLYYAVINGWTQVRAIVCEVDDWVRDFVTEAKKRGIFSPTNLILLPHTEYTEKWDRFCADFFADQED